MKIRGLGIDIVEIKRFTQFKNRSNCFLKNNYSEAELNYCFSFKEPDKHLAGIFAAKEAVLKASGQNKITLSMIEIRKNGNGKPIVLFKNRRQKSILVSISHTSKISVAVAVKNKP